MDKDFENQELENENADLNAENIENEVEESEVDILKNELGKERDNFLRLFAEFENYKKRTSKERLELFSTANKELMTALLPILDDFERGLNEIEKSSDNALLEGMQLIFNKFKNTLGQKGLMEMEVKQGDSFDADIHEAITQMKLKVIKIMGSGIFNG